MTDEMNFDGEELTRAILARTSGSACASARERLVGFADGELAAIDAELIGVHISGCADCAALAGALGRLSRDLPELAEIEPDVAFLHDVLVRTWKRPSVAARAAAWVREAGAALWQRPRIAWEAAYVGTAVLSLAFVLAGSPLAGMQEKVVELKRPVAQLRDDVSGTLTSAWEATATGADKAWENVATNLERGFGTLRGADASGQEKSEDSKGE